jgi:hypothetical protein
VPKIIWYLTGWTKKMAQILWDIYAICGIDLGYSIKTAVNKEMKNKNKN